MLIKIISGILILITVYLNFSHGYSGLFGKMTAQESKMMGDLGIDPTLLKLIGVISLAIAVLVLFPQTFFIANLLNAGVMLLIMAYALKTGHIKTAFIEIPFLLMPLLLIWLGHPLKGNRLL